MSWVSPGCIFTPELLTGFIILYFKKKFNFSTKNSHCRWTRKKSTPWHHTTGIKLNHITCIEVASPWIVRPGERQLKSRQFDQTWSDCPALDWSCCKQSRQKVKVQKFKVDESRCIYLVCQALPSISFSTSCYNEKQHRVISYCLYAQFFSF